MQADDARILAIGYAQQILFLDQGQTVRNVERSAKCVEQLSIGRELHDPLVAVAISHEDDSGG